MSRKPSAHTTSNQPITINDAIEAGLKMIPNEVWRRHQSNSANAGIRSFLKEKYPKLKLWIELKPLHIHEFNLWMHGEKKFGKATANNYTNPARKASAYVQLYHPEQWTNLFQRKMKRQREVRPERFLLPDQLATAAKVARDMNEPSVVFALTFGGLAGLGIAEIMSLTGEDITTETITVMRDKTPFRRRVIPIVDSLKPYAAAFRQLYSQFPIRGEFVLSQKARKVLDRTSELTGDPTYKLVSLHDATRVSFANAASQAGAEPEYIRAYLGHAPQTVLESNYLKLIPRHDDLPRIKSAKLQQLQSRVLTKLNPRLCVTVFA